MNDLTPEEQKLMDAMIAVHKLDKSSTGQFGFGQPVQITGRLRRVRLNEPNPTHSLKANRVWERTQMIVPMRAIFLGRCVISDGEAWVDRGSTYEPEYTQQYSTTKAHRAALIAIKSPKYPHGTVVEKVFLEDVWMY